jgi:hypothetical protein
MPPPDRSAYDRNWVHSSTNITVSVPCAEIARARHFSSIQLALLLTATAGVPWITATWIAATAVVATDDLHGTVRE